MPGKWYRDNVARIATNHVQNQRRAKKQLPPLTEEEMEQRAAQEDLTMLHVEQRVIPPHEFAELG